MPDKLGRFQKGEHWRKPREHWDAGWLRHEYVERGRSASDIAAQQGITTNAILFWLHKHGIPRRSISETRRAKHWGASGSANPMYGRSGSDNPNWKGGSTPERQAFYSSRDWGYAVKAVWKRDEATCQRCKSKPSKTTPFHIHHRITFGVAEIRANIDNLVLLCRPCHHWVHSKKNVRRQFLGAFQTSMGGGETNGGEDMG